LNFKDKLKMYTVVLVLVTLLCAFTTAAAQGNYTWNIAFANCTPEYTGDSIAPSFPGGDAALFEKLRKEVRYPQIALETGVEGAVYIKFTVNRDSTISDIKTLRDNGENYCSKEVIRVLEKLPKWNPASKKGRPVSGDFVLKAYFEYEYIRERNASSN
jgi:TonB family protein